MSHLGKGRSLSLWANLEKIWPSFGRDFGLDHLLKSLKKCIHTMYESKYYAFEKEILFLKFHFRPPLLHVYHLLAFILHTNVHCILGKRGSKFGWIHDKIMCKIIFKYAKIWHKMKKKSFVHCELFSLYNRMYFHDFTDISIICNCNNIWNYLSKLHVYL